MGVYGKTPREIESCDVNKTGHFYRALLLQPGRVRAMRRAVIYLRVSTLDQTTANQERELREIAGRMGCEIVKVYKDHGISGVKGRDQRPAFDKLCRDAARREFDMVMAWSVDVPDDGRFRRIRAGDDY
jgi:predicted site-specific integrase-resolvase